MKSALIVLITSILLTACSDTNFDQDLRSAAAPMVRKYTPAEQEAAAREIQAQKCDPRLNDLRECSIPQIIEFLKDYKVLRDDARVLADPR